MNIYEKVLHELYCECFKRKYLVSIKGLNKFQKIGYVIMCVSTFILIFSSVGVMGKSILFLISFVVSYSVLFLSALSFFIYNMIYHKKFDKKYRENRVGKLSDFNILLIQHGLAEDKIIINILDSLKTSYLYRRQKLERKHDMLFKYIVTFIFAVLIFIAKEKWGRMKAGLSDEDFNVLFTSIFIMSIAIIFVLVISYYGTRNTPRLSKEERLIEVLEEVLIYRKKIRITIDN